MILKMYAINKYFLASLLYSYNLLTCGKFPGLAKVFSVPNASEGRTAGVSFLGMVRIPVPGSDGLMRSPFRIGPEPPP